MSRIHLALLTILTVLTISACKKTNADGPLMDAGKEAELLSTYFSAATTGIISAADPLTYIFNSPLATKPSDEQIQNIISISPSVDGIVTLSNNTILTFTPTEGFKPNTTYTITLNLKSLDGARFEKDITYSVRTFKQDLAVEPRGFIINDDGSVSMMAIVSTADKAKVEDIQKCFTSSASSTNVVELEANRFQVEFVFKQGMNSSTQITYDGSSLGSDTKGEVPVFEVDQSNFTVVHTQHDPTNKEFKVYFSQRINPDVDLTGLVNVNNTNAKLNIQSNVLTLYLSDLVNDQKATILLSSGITSEKGKKLGRDQSFEIEIEAEKPSIEFLDAGVYFPSEGNFKIPVRSKGLESIQLMVIEIKQENVNSFLTWQSLEYTDYYAMRMFGKPIYNQKVKLDKGIADADGWRVYGIDLSKQIARNPGSIYHVSMEFTPEDVSLACKDELIKRDIQSKLPDEEFYTRWENYYRDYYYYDDFNWEETENPCDISFYANRSPVNRTLICSDFGVIAKQAGNGYHIALTKLQDLSNVGDANITLYDLQGAALATGKTSVDGFAELVNLKADAAVVKIEKNNQITYLKLNPAESNPLTEFAINGSRSEDDAQFFVYTDRDVWRPGDSIYVDLMINASNITLPDGLPIVFSFYNPDNLLIGRKVQTLSQKSKLIYSFTQTTPANAKTGAYRGVMEIGSKKIVKRIRIETIKPNTAEATYTFDNTGKEYVLSDRLSGKVNVNYLTGFEVKSARVKLIARPRKIDNPFPKFKDYFFGNYKNDPVNAMDLGEVVTGPDGSAKINANPGLKQLGTPIFLSLESEITLPGGGSNKQGNTIKVSPFDSYVGLKKLDGQGWSGNHLRKENIKVELVNVDGKGDVSTAANTLDYTIQKRVSFWWIDKYMLRSSGFYYDESYWTTVKTQAVKISGKTTLTLPSGSLDDGAYRIAFKDRNSGHETETYFTVYSSEQSIPGTQPYIIQFEVSKEEVNAGEPITIKFPQIPGAKALISIEKANKIIQKSWFSLDEKNGEVTINTNADWSPNVYIHATIIQPYAQDNNDMPLRMYGIKPLIVNSNAKELKPVATLPDKLESNHSYTFTVSEEKGRAMEYTLALVDEGLLNLTGFKTPDPYNHFQGDFPLLVKTWDIYQSLMQYFKGKFAGILAIGGDDAYNPDAIAEVSRFKPLSLHQGSYKISAGGKNSHTINIPNYIGKVRLMIVACNESDFGKLSKTSVVKNPLMVQTQLPRALNVTDKLQIPINIIRDEKSISSAKIEAKTDGNLIKGLQPSTSVSFSSGDQVSQMYNVDVQNKPGKANLNFKVTGGGKTMTETTDILINYPNAYASAIKEYVIQPGKSLKVTSTVKGYAEAYKAKLMISGQKVPNFTKYAEELIAYPYGCLEQTTSGAFSQLFLDKVLQLDPTENRARLENLQAAVNKLQRFQHADGKLYYWDNDYYHAWSDIYGGDFLTEMNKEGMVGQAGGMLDNWLKSHTNTANGWNISEASSEYVYESEVAVQAYRLYVLAKAGRPAKSAMNRFAATCKSKQALTWWFLAGAHQLASYDTKALEFVTKAESMQIANNGNGYNTFGSDARNLALAVEVLSAFPSQKKKASLYYDNMVDAYNKSGWLSTQDKGFAFKAAYRFFGSALNVTDKISYALNAPSGLKSYELSSIESKTFHLTNGDIAKAITIENKGKSAIHVYQIERFIDSEVVKAATASDLNINVTYNGSSTPPMVNIGQDILIDVAVSNPLALAQSDLALNLKMPSGWELINPRLYETERNVNTNALYQDYKDDRVYTFFNIPAGGNQIFHFRAKAAFIGNFFAPAATVENMYNGSYYASTASGRVEVKK